MLNRNNSPQRPQANSAPIPAAAAAAAAASSSSGSSNTSATITNTPFTSTDEKEKEKKLAEQRAQNALKLQRKQRLEALIRKRKSNLMYLKKVHEGKTFWLNATLFTKDDLKLFIKHNVPKARIESYFYLGLSLARILSLNAGIQTVRAFSQLVEEWEYYNAGTAYQSMKYVMAKNSPCYYPQTIPNEHLTELSRPSIYKFSNNIVYEYLQIFPLAYELDYMEVVITLADIFFKLYEKLFHPESFSNQVAYDTIVRLDTRVKHHFINLIAKEYTELSIHKMKLNTNQLRILSGARVSDQPVLIREPTK